jgi:2-polyprenyl-3-methyl-5-hydroxy-6-metoxy-1,4-benzoquinol methylase
MAIQNYADKGLDYFSHARVDIAPLLPTHAPRVLDIGCGAGATLRWLKAQKVAQETVGVELFEDAAAAARPHVDHVVVGNAEALIDSSFGMADKVAFDLVLCLDVLEHMVDPWGFVQKLERLIKPGGLLIGSIPNVRHLRTSLPLLMAGQWRYRSEGILDRTHLRFFTKESALELLTTPTLSVEKWLHAIPGKSARVLNKLTLGMAKDLLALEYLIASKRVHP